MGKEVGKEKEGKKNVKSEKYIVINISIKLTLYKDKIGIQTSTKTSNIKIIHP